MTDGSIVKSKYLGLIFADFAALALIVALVVSAQIRLYPSATLLVALLSSLNLVSAPFLARKSPKPPDQAERNPPIVKRYAALIAVGSVFTVAGLEQLLDAMGGVWRAVGMVLVAVWIVALLSFLSWIVYDRLRNLMR